MMIMMMLKSAMVCAVVMGNPYEPGAGQTLLFWPMFHVFARLNFLPSFISV